jgi:hypothetical protein
MVRRIEAKARSPLYPTVPNIVAYFGTGSIIAMPCPEEASNSRVDPKAAKTTKKKPAPWIK